MIDREKRQTNAYGNRRSGNTARERQRVAAGGVSTRRAIAGLPLNFYDKTWYAGLSAWDRALLNAKPDMDAPVLVRYDYFEIKLLTDIMNSVPSDHHASM